jgi:hypothetical protein
LGCGRAGAVGLARRAPPLPSHPAQLAHGGLVERDGGGDGGKAQVRERERGPHAHREAALVAHARCFGCATLDPKHELFESCPHPLLHICDRGCGRRHNPVGRRRLTLSCRCYLQRSSCVARGW